MGDCIGPEGNESEQTLSLCALRASFTAFGLILAVLAAYVVCHFHFYKEDEKYSLWHAEALSSLKLILCFFLQFFDHNTTGFSIINDRFFTIHF